MPAHPSESISSSLRLAKAAQLAQRGRLHEAQSFLAPQGALPEDTGELHALAAIVTLEGDYARAMAFWKTLLVREPNHAEARRMVTAIELWLSRPSWYRFIPIVAAVLAGLLLAGILFWTLSGPDLPPPKPRPAPVTQYDQPPARPANDPAIAPLTLTPPPAKRKPAH